VLVLDFLSAIIKRSRVLRHSPGIPEKVFLDFAGWILMLSFLLLSPHDIDRIVQPDEP